jgi:hypothetical protein
LFNFGYDSLDVISQGIGTGLTFLGQYLATKKRKSPMARYVARLLGTDVDAINRDHILQQLKNNKEYFKRIREQILIVLETSSIDEFARAFSLSTGEAWEVYRMMKDMVLDSEIIRMIAQVSSIAGQIENNISNEAQSLIHSIDEQFKKLSERHKELERELYQNYGLSWLPRNYFEYHRNNEKDVEDWKKGFGFGLASIMEEKEFRRNSL